MLGHSIVPHHHHGYLDDNAFHSHSNNDIHSDFGISHELFDNVFSFVPHGKKGVECISCPNMDETFNKQYFTFFAILPTYIGINFTVSVSEKYFFDYPDALIISNYFPPGGLRAPPVFS
jgi:hypothetical protein